MDEGLVSLFDPIQHHIMTRGVDYGVLIQEQDVITDIWRRRREEEEGGRRRRRKEEGGGGGRRR